MPGPYFSGQEKSPCQHYYPDVIRLRDEKKPDETFVRILNCSHCGNYEIPLDAETLEPGLKLRLTYIGVDVGTKESELAKVRKQARKRLSSQPNLKSKLPDIKIIPPSDFSQSE